MKKSVGHGFWIPRLQSTLYYQRLWQSEVDAEPGAMDNPNPGAPALAGVSHVFDEIANLNACFERCADEAVAAVRPLRTVRYDAGDRTCRCFDVSLFSWTFDSLNATENGLWHIMRGSTAQWYETKFCEFVRPDTVCTLVLHTLHSAHSVRTESYTFLQIHVSFAARAHPRVVQEPPTSGANRRLVLGLAGRSRCALLINTQPRTTLFSTSRRCRPQVTSFNPEACSAATRRDRARR